MEEKILAAETEVSELEAKLSRPEVLGDHRQLSTTSASLATAQATVARLYERWAELEAKQK